jgi:hypothetical protein
VYLVVGTAYHFKTGNAFITVYPRKDMLGDVIKNLT